MRTLLPLLTLTACTDGAGDIDKPEAPDEEIEVCAAQPEEDRNKGDANGDGAVDLADAAWIRAAVFSGGEGVVCLDAIDLHDDDRLNADDA